MPETRRGRDCYRHYAICGEARAAARFMGRALAPPLRVAREGDKGTASRNTHEPLKDLFNGKDGQAQMLESIGIHLTIARGYLIGRNY